ncbi:Fc.00g104480.m01.CDS01 [Cosmosporella sp. VM-42]
MSPVTSIPQERLTKGFGRVTSCVNGRRLHSCALIALPQVNFGMDQGAFNGRQTMDALTRKFGE